MIQFQGLATDLSTHAGERAGHAAAAGKRLPLRLALALGLGACGQPAPPRWIDLTSALADSTQRIDTREHVLPDGRKVRVRPEEGEVWLELTLGPEDWQTRQGLPNFWLGRVPLLLTGGGRTNSSGFRLRAGAREFAPAPGWELEKGFPPQCFFVGHEGVLVHLAKGEKPAAETTLSLALHGAGDGAGRVWGRRYSGRGFQLWPGQTLSLAVDVPRGSVLRFATTLEPMVEGVSEGAAPVEFRVLQDGVALFEHALDPAHARAEWQCVAPRHAGRSELTFEVRGTLAVASFLAPTLAPAETGAPGRRPWSATRPDVVLFLADTFRADNLGAYGGTLGLTPNLDRLAEEGLLFPRAWSVGTYTLPAHVSMFTGVMPYQAGLKTIHNALPDGLETIAERLHAAGYRTGAITDAGIVSRRFAFDQGFDYFDEKQESIESTVARALAFLDADDGRPTFLFVHTYRAHVPYEVSEETRARLGERLAIPGEFHAVEKGLVELAQRANVPFANGKYTREFLGSAAAAPILADLRALYLGGVVDVDRGFGAFRRALEERRWLAHGKLIFTSDHGEAFGEHGEIQHGDKVFEEKVRIPLILVGAGIPRGRSSHAASLVDVTPTIAAMAGLPASPEWVGESLLALARDRAVFSFGFDDDTTFAVVEGPRKVIGFQAQGRVEDGRVLGGFDLAADPREQRDVRAAGETWPEEMIRRFQPAIERALVPALEARAAELDSADMDELGKLGYGR